MGLFVLLVLWGNDIRVASAQIPGITGYRRGSDIGYHLPLLWFPASCKNSIEGQVNCQLLHHVSTGVEDVPAQRQAPAANCSPELRDSLRLRL